MPPRKSLSSLVSLVDLRVSPLTPIGAPGSGKGTLCKKLSHDYGFQHLSVGDMLRQRVSVSGLDAETTALVQKGELVPTHTMIGILQDHIDHHVPDSPRVIMVDGFPRRLDQALAAEKQVRAPDRCHCRDMLIRSSSGPPWRCFSSTAMKKPLNDAF